MMAVACMCLLKGQAQMIVNENFDSLTTFAGANSSTDAGVASYGTYGNWGNGGTGVDASIGTSGSNKYMDLGVTNSSELLMLPVIMSGIVTTQFDVAVNNASSTYSVRFGQTDNNFVAIEGSQSGLTVSFVEVRTMETFTYSSSGIPNSVSHTFKFVIDLDNRTGNLFVDSVNVYSGSNLALRAFSSLNGIGFYQKSASGVAGDLTVDNLTIVVAIP